MDEETKEARNFLSTIQSSLQELQQIAESKENNEAKDAAEIMESDLYDLAGHFGFGTTDF